MLVRPSVRPSISRVHRTRIWHFGAYFGLFQGYFGLFEPISVYFKGILACFWPFWGHIWQFGAYFGLFQGYLGLFLAFLGIFRSIWAYFGPIFRLTIFEYLYTQQSFLELW